MTPSSLVHLECAVTGKANAIISKVAAMLFAIDRIDDGFCFIKISLTIDVKFSEYG